MVSPVFLLFVYLDQLDRVCITTSGIRALGYSETISGITIYLDTRIKIIKFGAKYGKKFQGGEIHMEGQFFHVEAESHSHVGTTKAP